MSFKINMIYPGGEEEIQDEEYATYEDAEKAAEYLCSCFSQGGEILALAGEEYSDGSADFDIFEE